MGLRDHLSPITLGRIHQHFILYVEHTDGKTYHRQKIFIGSLSLKTIYFVADSSCLAVVFYPKEDAKRCAQNGKDMILIQNTPTIARSPRRYYGHVDGYAADIGGVQRYINVMYSNYCLEFTVICCWGVQGMYILVSTIYLKNIQISAGIGGVCHRYGYS